MKDTILFKIGNVFICLTELGNVVAIEDTEDNRNPKRGALTRMGVNSFEARERTSPVLLTPDNLSGVIKQISESVSSIVSPLMDRLNNLESKNKDIEERFKMMFNENEQEKANRLLSPKPVKSPEKGAGDDYPVQDQAKNLVNDEK